MSGWTDLNSAMAFCWKVSWNVDPLPSTVPDVPVPLLGDDPPLAGDELADDELAGGELPQAPTRSAATTASAAPGQRAP